MENSENLGSFSQEPQQQSQQDLKFQQHNFGNKKVLFDLKECEHLFQKDKSQKQQKDIEGIQKEIEELKNIENQYYADLLIHDDFKETIFGLKPITPYKKKYVKKIIGQDPVYGNQVLTREEFKERYGRYPQ